MIKGCQKRVLWVKNIDSECFDGAFFIVSDKSGAKVRTEGSMIDEANRIISEHRITNYFDSEKDQVSDKKDDFKYIRVKWFSAGALLVAAVSLLLQIF